MARSVLGEAGDLSKWSSEDFGGSETILYDAAMVNTWHYTFFKTTEL